MTEDEVMQFLSSGRDDPVSDFLMKLLGLDLLPMHSHKLGAINVCKTWRIPGIEQANLFQVTRRVYHHLLNAILAIPVPKIATALDVERDYVDLAIKWCEDIELLPNEMVQAALARLPNAQDKAYRILHQHDGPMHFREIARQINKVDSIASQSLSQSLTLDNRFEPIERSGYWRLIMVSKVVMIGLKL